MVKKKSMLSDLSFSFFPERFLSLFKIKKKLILHAFLISSILKCNNSNSTLAVRSGFNLHRFLPVFGKKK